MHSQLRRVERVCIVQTLQCSITAALMSLGLASRDKPGTNKLTPDCEESGGQLRGDFGVGVQAHHLGILQTGLGKLMQSSWHGCREEQSLQTDASPWQLDQQGMLSAFGQNSLLVMSGLSGATQNPARTQCKTTSICAESTVQQVA